METESTELTAQGKEDNSPTTPRELTTLLRCQGLTDDRVMEAIERVPRERFVPEADRWQAWKNRALPIAERQTISQPYVVALMTIALRVHPGDRVLEIGTGSGYQAAVLAELGAAVHSIERHAELAEAAGRRLAMMGYRDVRIRVGDGTLGWPEEAPFDAIIVTAGAPRVPPTLLAQLNPNGGRLVIPAGSEHDQTLILVEKKGGATHERTLGPVRFVPLIGDEGWGA